MPATILGELSADRSHIILMGLGDDHSLAVAQNLTETLTPLVKPTVPQGALQLPLSWPAVVQLATTYGADWRPGPALTEWVGEQVRRRAPHGSGDPAELAVTPPAGLTPYSWQVEAAVMIRETGSALLFDEPGPQPVATPILTPDGWATLGSLEPGAVVFDLHGRPARVRTVKHFGEQPVYRVTLNDRTSTLATGNHRWRVYTANDRKRGTRGRVLSTDALRTAGLRTPAGAARYFLPQQPVVQGVGDGGDLPLDPYLYGLLLGDGGLSTEDLSITCPDDFVLRHAQVLAAAVGTTSRRSQPEGRCEFVALLDELGARVRSEHKTVHWRYRLVHEGARRGVLAGLLDTDGTVIRTGAGVEFSSASPRLAADVAWLARSLGAVVTESAPQPAGYRGAGGQRVECQPKHRVLMRFPADGPNPFWLPRKANAWAHAAARVQRRNPPRTIQAIEPAGTAEVCCIELDTDDAHARVYLTDEALIPTHNTGKTPATILGLVERAAAGHEVRPVVVVAPMSVVDSWVEHVRTWAPRWTALAWRGSPDRRRKLMGCADVYVTSYGTARRDADEANLRKSPLLALEPRTVVADEMHLLKRQTTEQSQAVRRLAARAARHGGGFVGLSGTPITHHPGDLWPALTCLEPGAWPSRERWVTRYCHTIAGDYASKVLGLRADVEPEFRRALLGRQRRVAKADVLAELPPKVYSVRTVELPAAYRKAYDDMEADMLAELPDGGELSVMSVLAQLTRLAQLASAAADVEVTYETVEENGLLVERPHTKVTLRAPSWKVDALLEVLDERPGQPVVTFAPSRQLMMLAGQAAQKAGLRVGYIVGGQSAAERTGNVDAFQRGELDLICVTTGAGGVGLTLTAARTAVFLQRPWSLVEALQSEDRLHRIGAERHDSIEIIDVVARKTIDTRVRTVLRERAGQLADLVQDPRVVAELLGGAGVRDLRRAS